MLHDIVHLLDKNLLFMKDATLTRQRLRDFNLFAIIQSRADFGLCLLRLRKQGRVFIRYRLVFVNTICKPSNTCRINNAMRQAVSDLLDFLVYSVGSFILRLPLHFTAKAHSAKASTRQGINCQAHGVGRVKAFCYITIVGIVENKADGFLFGRKQACICTRTNQSRLQARIAKCHWKLDTNRRSQSRSKTRIACSIFINTFVHQRLCLLNTGVHAIHGRSSGTERRCHCKLRQFRADTKNQLTSFTNSGLTRRVLLFCSFTKTLCRCETTLILLLSKLVRVFDLNPKLLSFDRRVAQLLLNTVHTKQRVFASRCINNSRERRGGGINRIRNNVSKSRTETLKESRLDSLHFVGGRHYRKILRNRLRGVTSS